MPGSEQVMNVVFSTWRKRPNGGNPIRHAIVFSMPTIKRSRKPRSGALLPQLSSSTRVEKLRSSRLESYSSSAQQLDVERAAREKHLINGSVGILHFDYGDIGDRSRSKMNLQKFRHALRAESPEQKSVNRIAQHPDAASTDDDSGKNPG